MNAYFEIFGSTTRVPKDDEKALWNIEHLETAQVEKVSEDCRGRRRMLVTFKVTPDIDSAPVREWLDNVLWAWVSCNGTFCHLESLRNTEKEMEFLNTLKSIDYDEGYGSQELFGIIVFKDGSWMDRYEYDGSEHWVHNKCPEEPDWSDLSSCGY